jgi:hypothetical protein
VEAERKLTMLHAFQDLMMYMGLPYKDVHESNLHEKMKILDRLTPSDWKKFLVQPRPQLFDPNYKPKKQEPPRAKTITDRLK